VLQSTLPCEAAHGKACARHRAAARQRMRARLSVGRTATYARTAKPPAHGNAVPHGTDFGARQRTERTAEGFAVQNEHAHGNVGFAVATFAGQTLPCARARQSLCRAYRCLCRAKWRTATPCSPVVSCQVSDWIDLSSDGID
jgi:hypothetical protein